MGKKSRKKWIRRYPTLGKGKLSTQTCQHGRDMLVASIKWALQKAMQETHKPEKEKHLPLEQGISKKESGLPTIIFQGLC